MFANKSPLIRIPLKPVVIKLIDSLGIIKMSRLNWTQIFNILCGFRILGHIAGFLQISSDQFDQTDAQALNQLLMTY